MKERFEARIMPHAQNRTRWHLRWKGLSLSRGGGGGWGARGSGAPRCSACAAGQGRARRRPAKQPSCGSAAGSAFPETRGRGAFRKVRVWRERSRARKPNVDGCASRGASQIFLFSFLTTIKMENPSGKGAKILHFWKKYFFLAERSKTRQKFEFFQKNERQIGSLFGALFDGKAVLRVR